MIALSHSDSSKTSWVHGAIGYRIVCAVLCVICVCVLVQQEAAFLRLFRSGITEQISKANATSGKGRWPTQNVGNTSAFDTENANPPLAALSQVVGRGGDGEWVHEPSYEPLYSGTSCKWIAPQWACKATARPSFAYEQYRWQPRGENWPDFDRDDFLQRMQDRTVAFIGDSLGQQQFQALLCMLAPDADPKALKSSGMKDVSKQYSLRSHSVNGLGKGWAYRFLRTNTTVLFSWSTCLCHVELYNLSDPNGGSALHLDRPDSFLATHFRGLDVLILNTGHHWSRTKLRSSNGQYFLQGEPADVGGKKPLQMSEARKMAAHSTVNWIDSQVASWRGREEGEGGTLPSRATTTGAEFSGGSFGGEGRGGKGSPHVYLSGFSPRHFVGGEWNMGGGCENVTMPLESSSVEAKPLVENFAQEAVLRSGVVKLLDITALSHSRADAHPSQWAAVGKANKKPQDCLHWCLPGVPDVWNQMLYASLRNSEVSEIS